MTYTFEIMGEAVAKARARTYRSKKGFVGSYTPETTVRWEQHCRNTALLFGVKPLHGPVEARLIFMFALPRSLWRKNPVKESLMESGKDADNLAKSVLDALNGVAYADDRQVAILHVQKIRRAQGEDAKVLVELTNSIGDW